MQERYRKYPYSSSVGGLEVIQKLFDYITETRETLIKEIEVVSFESFNFNPTTYQWSIGQVTHHLYLSEEYFIESIKRALESLDQRIENKPIELVLDRSIKVESPEFAKPSKGPLMVNFAIEMLHNSRERLIEQINRIDDEKTLDLKGREHPLFGQLSIKQWIQFLNFHEIRHIGQIRDLKKN